MTGRSTTKAKLSASISNKKYREKQKKFIQKQRNLYTIFIAQKKSFLLDPYAMDLMSPQSEECASVLYWYHRRYV